MLPAEGGKGGIWLCSSLVLPDDELPVLEGCAALHSYGGTKHDKRSEFANTEMLLHDVDNSKGSRLYSYTQDDMACEKVGVHYSHLVL